jgi:hypothetical protein
VSLPLCVAKLALSAPDAAFDRDRDGLAIGILQLSEVGAIEDAVAIWADPAGRGFSLAAGLRLRFLPGAGQGSCAQRRRRL